MVNGQCLTTMVTTSWRSSRQDMGFGGLGMANSKSGDYNLFSSGQVLELLRWPQCWFHKIEVSAMYSYIPLGLNQRLNVGVDQWFHICIVNTCQWVYLLVEGLFYGGGLWARNRGAVKCMTLHLWAANLKPFLVAHSSMAFTACCKCLSMVSRERPRKQIARSSTKSALKMSLAIQEGSSLIFSPKHVTARTPPVGTPSSG